MTQGAFSFSRRDSILQRLRRLIFKEWFLLLLITVLAAALRLYALDRLPPGLYHDEAYNGLDALDVLRGLRPIFFEANNGREPLFIYLVSLSIALLGRSPLAIRIVAALLGTLTVPVAYLMARELLGRREALLTALVTAITFWHLNLSRIGFRAVSLPLFSALCLWWFARGLHQKRWYGFALAGLCLGVAQYTYIAARFVAVTFLILSVYWLGRRQPVNRRWLLLFFGVALVVASPLLVYFAQHMEAFLARSDQVSVFNPTINHGDLWGTLARHVGKTLGMFNWRGDFIPRHNMPYRPVFDLLIGLFFVLGLAISLRRAPHKPEYGMLFIFWLLMLIPTVLAEDAPHFLRAVGVLPVLFAFPAIGLTAFWDALKTRISRPVAVLAVMVILIWSSCTTVRDYFFRHMRSEAVHYNFETGAIELAAEINRFIGTGWQPASGLRMVQQTPISQRHVYLEERLWRDWATLRYLVPDIPNLSLLKESAPLPPPPMEDEVRIIVWPFAEHSRYLALLPRGHVISVQEGPLERGDLEKQARLLCLTYQAVPADHVPTNLQVCLEHGIELLGYELQPRRQGSLVRLYWRAGMTLETDYSVFVHLKRDGQSVGQSDSYPAQGYYPTHLWREGDIIADDHSLEMVVTSGQGYSLSIGLYQWQTGKRLQVLDGLGNPIGDSVDISVP
jgi:4-amino-4-deoxy-L-arabinose transferase-like glycosyltransferase